jgi:hypothetical protein
MAARLGFQDAGEYRLMKSELLLDRFRGQTDLPADLALAGGDPAVDQRKLDSIRFIQRKPVDIGLREELTAGACGPEMLDRGCKFDAHRQSSERVAAFTF